MLGGFDSDSLGNLGLIVMLVLVRKMVTEAPFCHFKILTSARLVGLRRIEKWRLTTMLIIFVDIHGLPVEFMPFNQIVDLIIQTV